MLQNINVEEPENTTWKEQTNNQKITNNFVTTYKHNRNEELEYVPDYAAHHFTNQCPYIRTPTNAKNVNGVVNEVTEYSDYT